MEELAHQVLPHGIGFEWTELAFQQQQQGTPTLLVFGAAALLVFLVLTAQYESWKLPLAVVLIVPMCLLASVTGAFLNRLFRLERVGDSYLARFQASDLRPPESLKSQ